MFRVAATAADFPSGKAEPTQLGMYPIRRRQRRMRGNLPGPEGLARRGASAALHGLPVVTTTGGAARLASAPSPCQRGSREILRQAPGLTRNTQTGSLIRAAKLHRLSAAASSVSLRLAMHSRSNVIGGADA